MSKISNVITMVELLQTGKKYSIKELANELEVTERMIRVYKEDLDKAILLSLSRTIDYVSSEGNYLDEDTVRAKEYFEEIINKGE